MKKYETRHTSLGFTLFLFFLIFVFLVFFGKWPLESAIVFIVIVLLVDQMRFSEVVVTDDNLKFTTKYGVKIKLHPSEILLFGKIFNGSSVYLIALKHKIIPIYLEGELFKRADREQLLQSLTELSGK